MNYLALRHSHHQQVQLINFLELEEIGTHQPRHCQPCKHCTRCADRSVHMTDKEAAELLMIESNIEVDMEQKKVKFRYPLLKDACLLHDNRSQAITIESRVEKRLAKEGLLENYDGEIQGYIDHGVFRELGEREMKE